MKIALGILSLMTALPSPTPTSLPVPRETPLSLAFYFSRPARIFSWTKPEEAGWIADTDYVVTEERPFLTQDGFYRAHWVIQAGAPVIRVKLNRSGNALMDEAVLGNIGRTVVMVWNGKIRDIFELRPRFHPNDIVLQGNLTPEEAETITQLINYRPTPTPSPAATPTPIPTPKDSVLSIF